MEKNSIEIDGLALKRVLRRTRLSAGDLAERAGCHVQTIYRLQQGRGKTTFSLLDDLGRIVGTEVVGELIVDDADREDFLNQIRPSVDVS